MAEPTAAEIAASVELRAELVAYLLATSECDLCDVLANLAPAQQAPGGSE